VGGKGVEYPFPLSKEAGGEKRVSPGRKGCRFPALERVPDTISYAKSPHTLSRPFLRNFLPVGRNRTNGVILSQ